MFVIPNNNKSLQEAVNERIPLDFDWRMYLSLNADLRQSGIADELSAKYHYIKYGHKEHRTYKYKHLIDVDIDTNFDYKFYINEYPDVISYYKTETLIPLEQKAFHHYMHYGKAEGRFKNLYEYNHSLDNSKTILYDIEYNIELNNPSNQLQAIYLLTTQQEIKNKRYQSFIEQLILSTQQNNISKKIEFNIVINKDTKIPSIKNLSNIFKCVNIVNLKLDENQDVYFTKMPTDGYMPQYGLKSGPNITFFQTMREAYAKYNTILLLETDCILYPNWLTNIYNYIEYANGFLISGATYDGNVFMKAGSPMLTHINGGTALYATYHPALQHFLSILEKFILLQVASTMPGLAYDYAAKLLIDYQINHPENSLYNNFWHFINRNYLSNKLIFNCCTSLDQNINVDHINTKYNPAILHKKI